jgi:hypothetical protein
MSYENSMLNLYSPSGLIKGNGEISLKHRFLGDISRKPLDDFFGMDEGANVNLGIRYQLLQNFEVKLEYCRLKTEYLSGLAYLFKHENIPLSAQIDVAYFHFKEPMLNGDVRANFLYNLSLQTDPLWEKFILTTNSGYDGYYQRFVSGLGLLYQVNKKISFITEYYPVQDKNTSDEKLLRYLGKKSATAFGMKYDTYGHHFKFMISNNENFNVHRLSLGSSGKNIWKFGFNIERKLGY